MSIKAGSAVGQLVPAKGIPRLNHNMNITVKDLLDAGVHFGHQVRRFNPKSKKFVFANRQGISVIDLEKTYARLEAACAFVEQLVASGQDILFVGTKRQAKELLKETAVACNMPYATSRWLGGTLTNFSTISRSIEKYKNYLRMDSDGSLDKMHNKESSAVRREMSRMNRNFEGIINMAKMPGALLVVDTRNEDIAVAEANRLKIPVVALVDTNSDPTLVTYPIPGNDDSIKSIRMIIEVLMDAVQAGLARRVSNEPVITRRVTPIAEPVTKERQIPVTVLGIHDTDEDSVPEVFSSDMDEEKF